MRFVKNAFKTAVLLAGLGGLLMVIGGLLTRGSPVGFLIGGGIGLLFVGFSYWKSDVLAIKAARAVPVTREQMPEFYEIMEELKISRGNAHKNLRDLVSWGLVRSVVRKGERKEYFEAEKDVWKMFCIIIRERRRRELRPADVRTRRRCRRRRRAARIESRAAFPNPPLASARRASSRS